MHLGKFHHAVNSLNVDYLGGDVKEKLNAVIQQLEVVVSHPGDSAYVNILKNKIDELRDQLASSILNKPYPTLAALLDSMEARDFVGDKLFEHVQEILINNGMAPQLAVKELRKLYKDVVTFFENIAIVDRTFTLLKVEYEKLMPGEGEIGISIPEPDGERLLSTLADTAKAWDKALRPFVELSDPEHNPIAVRTISSSDWQFYLTAAAGVYFSVSLAVSRLNDLLHKLIETKKLISLLISAGVSTNAVAAVVAESEEKLDLETRKLGEEIVSENPPADTGRANELKTAVTASLKFMARQMAENVTIEVRYLPPKKAESDVPTDQKESTEETARIGELTEMAEKIERNMDIVRLDDTARAILNLPAPEEEIEQR